MSKSAHNILVAASVALMMFGYVSQADAQRSGDQTSSLSLLGNIQVQEELDLVDDQIKEIEELGSEMRASMREMVNSHRENMGDISDEERREAWADMQKEMKARYAGLQPKIEAVLLPAQVERLSEIRMQASIRRSGGLTSDGGGEVIKKELDISDDQMEAMKKKAVEVEKALATKIAKLKREAELEVLSVLETDQREKYKKMVGDVYDVESLFGRNGRFSPRTRQRNTARGRARSEN